MIDKLQLGRWDSALSNWGQSLNTPQLLWALRLFILALALLAGVYAIVHFISLLNSGAAERKQATALVASVENPAASLDANTVKGWNWYSDRQAASVDAGAAAARQADNVKKTRLQMRLEGIVKSDQDKESVAIIEINNKASQYKSGAKLPVAPGVFLRTIDVDRIILDNNGSLEELLLFSKDMVQQRKSAAQEPATESGAVVDKSKNEDITQMMGRYREQISSNPGSINELIKFSAHTEDGKLAGFRIGAANNKQDFSRLGLQDGDVVTHVNGVELSDYRKALTLYKDIGDLSEVRVQMIREGQPQELIFRLPDEG